MTEPVECTIDEFHEHAEACDGVCLACGAWTVGGVEPDARNYTCEECGKRGVHGTEFALLLGRLKIIPD